MMVWKGNFLSTMGIFGVQRLVFGECPYPPGNGYVIPPWETWNQRLKSAGWEKDMLVPRRVIRLMQKNPAPPGMPQKVLILV